MARPSERATLLAEITRWKVQAESERQLRVAAQEQVGRYAAVLRLGGSSRRAKAARRLLAVLHVVAIAAEPAPESGRWEQAPDGGHRMGSGGHSAEVALPGSSTAFFRRVESRAAQAVAKLADDIEADLRGELVDVAFDRRQGRYRPVSKRLKCWRRECEGRGRTQRSDQPKCGWCGDPFGEEDEELEEAA